MHWNRTGLNPIIFWVNSNPKEYFELTQNHYVNKKHKGLARGTCGIDLKLYLDKVLLPPTMAYSIHGHICHILEAFSKRLIELLEFLVNIMIYIT